MEPSETAFSYSVRASATASGKRPAPASTLHRIARWRYGPNGSGGPSSCRCAARPRSVAAMPAANCPVTHIDVLPDACGAGQHDRTLPAPEAVSDLFELCRSADEGP